MSYTIEEKYSLIKNKLLENHDTNPINIIKDIMKCDFINIHGPEHHFLDGGSLLTAIYNAGMKIDLSLYLDKLSERSIKMPGAMCGYWGICGSVASVGAVFSIIDGTGPLSNDDCYSEHMSFTSSVLSKMSEIGGPRCCKRNAFLSLTEAIKYANEHYSLSLPTNEIKCEFSSFNQQCLKKKCPFYHD